MEDDANQVQDGPYNGRKMDSHFKRFCEFLLPTYLGACYKVQHSGGNVNVGVDRNVTNEVFCVCIYFAQVALLSNEGSE